MAREKRPGLKAMLKEVVAAGRLKPENLQDYTRVLAKQLSYHEALTSAVGGAVGKLTTLDQQHYLEQLVETLPALRNAYAHGSPLLMGSEAITLRLCADIINQLFDPPAAP